MRIKPPLPTTTLVDSRRLRRQMTDAERSLWKLLRSGQLDGWKFRRQHPIPPYIADFCCVEKKLIVELDGSQHNEHADEVRTKFLKGQGWKMIRFWDNDALLATEAVVEAIWDTTVEPDPHPNPSPDGRGAQASSGLDDDE